MDLNRPVSEIMTEKVISVGPGMTIDTVRELLGKRVFHHLPVVNSEGFLLGIISTEDLKRIDKLNRKAGNKKGKPITAKNIMTKYPVFLSPDDTIGLALEIFLENRFHALPIVEDDRLVGIVTTHDALRYALEHPYME